MGFIINMIKADKNNQREDKVNIKAFDKIELANQKKKWTEAIDGTVTWQAGK